MDTCPSPNPNHDIQIKLLHQACLWFGGEHRLARYLNVEVGQIVAWLSGAQPVPDHVFLACLDVVRPNSSIA